jgi:mannose-1-phosphate guanylyltransferase
MSRQAKPKQFHQFVGQYSMIRTTFERVKGLVGVENVFVSVSQALLPELQAQLPELPASQMICETEARNTGPAMCLEVAWLSRQFAAEEVVASIPADDYITDIEAFHDLLRLSEDFLREHHDYILTPAVRPQVLDTGYSYFRVGESLASAGEEAIYRVADVAEKPNEERCQELIDSGIYYCHTGMYIWQLGYIAGLFQKLQPQMSVICARVAEQMQNATPDWQLIADEYSATEKMSIESAVTDKAPFVAMSVSDRIGWSDLGKWHIIKRMLSSDGANHQSGQVLLNEANNNLVYNQCQKKIVVLNDVSDLVVVETDDALFISSLKKSAQVKDCVAQLKDKGWGEYL